MKLRVRALLPVALLAVAAAPTTSRAASGFHAVRLLRDGMWIPGSSGEESPAVCRGFRLSAAAASRWFARARRVDPHTFTEQLDWTHCAAEGVLVGSDGRRRRWELDMSGRGRVIAPPGRDIYLAGPELPVR